ncbi:MAG TPA: HK97 gp10 family phage protein [Actinomycetes bacterium]|nr:HK97 gp10 family phage protein [Actinomycetes bacterium]
MAGRGVDIDVKGLRDLRRELKRIGPEFPKELRGANLEAAEVVARKARRNAPQGPHEGGGRVQPLVQSIRALANQLRGQVAIGGARAPHAVVTEFGGEIPRRGSDKSLIAKARAGHRSFASVGVESRTRVRKQPYLYRAIASERDEVLEVYGEALDRLTRRAFPERI